MADIMRMRMFEMLIISVLMKIQLILKECFIGQFLEGNKMAS